MRQRDRISASVGVSALGVAVFAIGGAPRWSAVVLALLAAAAVAAQVRSRRRFDRLSPLLVLLAIAAALTALQCVPLPANLLESLNPTAYELIVDGAKLAGDGEPWLLPLSLDPPNSRRALLELATYLALAWVALRFTASEQGRRHLAAAVVLVAGGAALVGLLHELDHATRLYGIYTLQHASRPFIMGPLLNPNSYGGLLAMGAVLAIGLAMHGNQTPRQRVFWGSQSLLCIAVALLTQSRGAAVALAVGLSVLAGVVSLQRWRSRQDVRRRPAELLRVTVPATFVVMSILALVVYLSAGGVAQQLDRTSSDELDAPLSKYAAWRSAAELIHESPWIGVGRGGFESSFTRVHPESAVNTFSHVENAYLQAVVDWGVPGALAIAMGLAWLVLLVARRWSGGPLAAGAIGALATIAVHSTVDLGLELPGIAVPVIAIAALLAYTPVVEAPSRALRRHVRMRAAATAAIGVLAVVVALPFGRTLSDDHQRLLELSRPTLVEAQQVMGRHPMDYVAPAEGARALLRAGRTTEGTALLNHALMLHPTHPDLHLWVARALLLAGKPAQARLEYVMALRGRRNPTELVKEVVAAYPAPGEAASALPDDDNTALIARVLGDAGRNDVALPYLARVAERNPLDASVHEVLARVAAEQKNDDVAEQAARRRAALTPTLAARLALARLLQRRGKLYAIEKVLGDLDRAGGSVEDQIAARLLVCEVHQGLANLPRARDCLRALGEVPGLHLRTRREIHRRLARIEDALGNPRRAAWERREAER